MRAEMHGLAALFGTAAVAFGLAAQPLAADERPVATEGRSATAMSRANGTPAMRWFRGHAAARERRCPATPCGSQVVVGLESMRDLASLREAYDFEVVRTLPSLRAAFVRVSADRRHALLVRGPADGRIRYVSPVGPSRRVSSVPSDPLVQAVDPATSLPFEWQFTATHVDRALDLTPGDPGIVVGVIDTGVDPVPDLRGKVDALWSVRPNGTVVSDPVTRGNDDMGHGTAVASIIAATVNDGFGMAGFGGAAHVIAIHAGHTGSFPDIAIALALVKLDELGVRIVNMSLGGSTPSEPILIDAIHKAAADGVLIVAAAGNEHDDVAWPAAALQPSGGARSFGLAVGATTIDGTLAGFSNSGKHLSLVAPGITKDSCGSGLLVALPPTDVLPENHCHPHWFGAGGALYGYASGTSFAAPEVAGVAALVWAARPELENYQVADIIKQSATRPAGTGWTPTMGCGVLDAGAAVQLATSRAAAESAVPDTTDDDACSTDGREPAAWPSEADQTISFPALRNRSLGAPDFTVRATASSSLAVSFTATGTCTVHGAVVHVSAVGICTITASQAGNASYTPARDVTRTFSIRTRR